MKLWGLVITSVADKLKFSKYTYYFRVVRKFTRTYMHGMSHNKKKCLDSKTHLKNKIEKNLKI